MLRKKYAVLFIILIDNITNIKEIFLSAAGHISKNEPKKQLTNYLRINVSRERNTQIRRV
jgi:hypothetical protein